MKILPNWAVNNMPKFFGGKKHPSLLLATYRSQVNKSGQFLSY
jgi:hypothetical protein